MLGSVRAGSQELFQEPQKCGGSSWVAAPKERAQRRSLSINCVVNLVKLLWAVSKVCGGWGRF